LFFIAGLGWAGVNTLSLGLESGCGKVIKHGKKVEVSVATSMADMLTSTPLTTAR